MILKALPWGVAVCVVLSWTSFRTRQGIRPVSEQTRIARIALYPESRVPRVFHRAGRPAARFDLTRFGMEILPLSILAQVDRAILIAPSGDVVGIDLPYGRMRWKLSANTLGFEPRAVSAFDSVRFHVLPRDGPSFARVDGRTGKVLAMLSSPSPALAQSICPLSKGALLFSFLDEGAPLWITDSSGQAVAKAQSPWSRLRDAHPLQTQAATAADLDSGHCVLALRAGGGFAVYSQQIVRTYPYVQPGSIGEVIVTRSRDGTGALTTRSRFIGAYETTEIAAVSDQAWIPSTSGLDIYSTMTGEYLRTIRFDHAVSRLSAHGSVLLLAGYDQGVPTLWSYFPLRSIDASTQ